MQEGALSASALATLIFDNVVRFFDVLGEVFQTETLILLLFFSRRCGL